MRIRAIAAAAMVLAGAAARAAERVDVCVNANSAPLDVIGIAEGIASRMFATAGVAVAWRHSREPASRPGDPAGRMIVVDIEMKAPPGRNPETMAYALPFEGVHIVVFYDRIQTRSRDNPGVRPTILAHVLTHEIAHILQCLVRHSATGVMKARWDASDYLDMTRSPLRFTPEDIELLGAGCRRPKTNADSLTRPAR